MYIIDIRRMYWADNGLDELSISMMNVDIVLQTLVEENRLQYIDLLES